MTRFDLRWALRHVSLENNRHSGHLGDVLNAIAVGFAQFEQRQVLVLVTDPGLWCTLVKHSGVGLGTLWSVGGTVLCWRRR